MLIQGKFLISYQIFDNIQVNNIGQTHVREILKDTQAFTINYRTEQIRDSNRTNKRLPQISWRRTYTRTSTYD